jgi:hypothetical protein
MVYGTHSEHYLELINIPAKNIAFGSLPSSIYTKHRNRELLAPKSFVWFKEIAQFKVRYEQSTLSRF